MKLLSQILIAWILASAWNTSAADKKIIFIAGAASHRPGQHEHRAGCLLFQHCLKTVPGVTSVVYTNGWPSEADALEGAAAVVIYSDGGRRHPVLQENRLQVLGDLAKRGVGVGMVHYAVEVPKDRGGAEFLDWIGGYFEPNWSVNPHWDAEFETLPEHPVTSGVKPFKIRDEWYYHMRFRSGMEGVTPILLDLPPASTLRRQDGPHSNNPHVRRAVLEEKQAQVVMWVRERPDGGRGFGFTGGHFHSGWGHDDVRKILLNAILWISKVEVPPNGLSTQLTPEQLAANLGSKGRK